MRSKKDPDKTRLLNRSVAGPETDFIPQAAWTVDQETGERVPEGGRPRADVEEEFAKAARGRFEAMKAEEAAYRECESVLAGLRREWHEAIARGDARGGTILKGDFRFIRK